MSTKYLNFFIFLKGSTLMFPERLKNLRKEAGLTQQQLADIVGTTQQNIGFWETGRQHPKNPSLVKLANYFNVTTDYLLGNTDEKESPLESATILFRSTIKDLNLTPEQEEQLKKDINNFIKKRRKAFEDDL